MEGMLLQDITLRDSFAHCKGPEQSLQTESNAGMIQRAVDQIFTHKQKLEVRATCEYVGWTLTRRSKGGRMNSLLRT